MPAISLHSSLSRLLDQPEAKKMRAEIQREPSHSRAPPRSSPSQSSGDVDLKIDDFPREDHTVSIHDFHSKLSARNENNLLFEALRRLRRLENARSLLFAVDDEEAIDGGWYPWDGIESPPHPAVAET